MKRVAVVVPFYSPVLSKDDRVSLLSFRRHLSGFDRILLSPEGLDVSAAVADDAGLKVEYFPRQHFSSWAAYNLFCRLPAFYERFLSYEYILIAQLDAYVFRNELDAWCDRGFGYLGTPWPGNRKRAWHLAFSYSGGGGFCLRRVDTFVRITKRLWPFRGVLGGLNEDAMFASKAVRAICPEIWRWPCLSEALRFGFDAEPERCLELNGNVLPFGCHGWTWPNRRKFWDRFIPHVSLCNIEDAREE